MKKNTPMRFARPLLVALLAACPGCHDNDDDDFRALTVAPPALTERDLSNPQHYATRVTGVLGDEGQYMLGQPATGDLNGDGRADLLLGAPAAGFNNRYHSGAIFVRFGSTDPLAGIVDLAPVANYDVRFDGAVTVWPGTGIGSAMAVGDLNGDGATDLAIGSAAEDSVYVIFGGPNLTRGVRDLAYAASWSTRFDGAAGDALGTSVVIGDVNNDGIGDLMMGAPMADPLSRADAGAVYVRFGSAQFPTGVVDLTKTANDITYQGAAAGDHLCVSAAVDVNANSVKDLVVAASDASPLGRAGAGLVYVMFGGGMMPVGDVDLSLPGKADIIYQGAAPGDAIGRTLVGGDVGSDPATDLVIGAPMADYNGRTDAGRVHIFFGSVNIATGVIDLAVKAGDASLGGAAAGHKLGTSVAVAGNLIAGAPGAGYNGRSGSGSAYVIFHGLGGERDMASAYDVRYDGAAAGDALGMGVGAGNVIGDAQEDIFLGAPTADASGRVDCGRVYGITTAPQAGTRDLASSANWQILFDGPSRGSQFATNYALADVNGDHVQDIIVSSPNENRNGRADSGSVYVIFGGPALAQSQSLSLDDPASYGLRIDGAAAYDYVGDRMLGMGDVNGDGIDDLILGSRYADNNGRANSGSVYVIFGRTSWAQATYDLASAYDVRIDGAAASDLFGYTYAVGDADGDGIGDLAIGALFTDFNGRANSGSLYLVHGRTSWPATLDMATAYDARFDGAAASDLAGFSPAIADLDGDGRGDLLFAAPFAGNNGKAYSGSVYVVYGKAIAPAGAYDLALATSYDVRLDGEAAGDQLGMFVTASDVDADGKADALLTAYGWNSEMLMDVGCAYVLYGGEPMAAGAHDLSISPLYDARVIGPVASGINIGATFARHTAAGSHDVIVTPNASGSVFVATATKFSGTVDLGVEGAYSLRVDATNLDNQLSAAYAYRGSTDVTGDGIDDLVLNERMGDATYWDAGNLYVIPGRP